MAKHECTSVFTISQRVRLRWLPIHRIVRAEITCGRLTDDYGDHSVDGRKHGGSVAGQIDGRPARLEVEW